MPPPSDTESMASCARSPEPPPKTPLPSRQEQARTSNNACFRFKQEGHWRKDSPFPSPIAANLPPAPVAAGTTQSCFACVAGLASYPRAGPARTLTGTSTDAPKYRTRRSFLEGMAIRFKAIACKGQGACDQFPWCYSAASPCGGNERINSLVPEEQKDPQAHEAKAAEVNNVIISRGTVVPTSRTQPPRSMREERENNYVDPLIRRINFEEDSPSKPVEGLKSISSRRVNDRENKTTVQVKWYESPANVNEAEKTFGINDPKNYGDEGLPNYSLVAEELDDYELCAVLEAIESKSSYNKAEDPKTYAAGAIKDSNILEESMVPTSPLPLPLQADHASHAGLLSSPMKCYRCGREGHWIKDFTNLPLLQVRPVCPLEEQRILV